MKGKTHFLLLGLSTVLGVASPLLYTAVMNYLPNCMYLFRDSIRSFSSTGWEGNPVGGVLAWCLLLVFVFGFLLFPFLFPMLFTAFNIPTLIFAKKTRHYAAFTAVQFILTQGGYFVMQFVFPGVFTQNILHDKSGSEHLFPMLVFPALMLSAFQVIAAGVRFWLWDWREKRRNSSALPIPAMLGATIILGGSVSFLLYLELAVHLRLDLFLPISALFGAVMMLMATVLLCVVRLFWINSTPRDYLRVTVAQVVLTSMLYYFYLVLNLCAFHIPEINNSAFIPVFWWFFPLILALTAALFVFIRYKTQKRPLPKF